MKIREEMTRLVVHVFETSGQTQKLFSEFKEKGITNLINYWYRKLQRVVAAPEGFHKT